MSPSVPTIEAALREVLQPLLLIAELHEGDGQLTVPRAWLEGWHAALTLALRHLLLQQTGGAG